MQHLVYDEAGDAGGLVPVAEMFEVCPLVAQLQHVDDDVCLGAAADRRVRVQEHPQQGGAGLHAAPQRQHFKHGLIVNMEASGLNIPSSKQLLHRIDDHCVIVSNALAPSRF